MQIGKDGEYLYKGYKHRWSRTMGNTETNYRLTFLLSKYDDLGDTWTNISRRPWYIIHQIMKY